MENETSNFSLSFTEDENLTSIFEFPEPYKTIRNVVNWANIGLVFISVAGNTMIIIVMTRKQNRNSSTASFFTALAVSDMSLALSVSFERWLHWTFTISIHGISPYLTTAKTVFTYSNIQISSWMLVCITVERIMSITLPYKIKDICTKTRARLTIFMVSSIIIALNTFEFTFIAGVHFDENFGIIWETYIENGGLIIAWMDFINSFFIPMSVIIVGSGYIIVHLLRIKIQKQATKNSRNRSVTMTLLAANIVFAVTMSPFVLIHLIYPNVDEVEMSPYLYWTISEVFLFLSDLNAALNFFVYVLSGSRFRSDVKQIFGFQDTNAETKNTKRKVYQRNAFRTEQTMSFSSISQLTSTPKYQQDHPSS